jgi:hypothetical protein
MQRGNSHGKHEVDEPVNVEERYLYAMIQRLDALCHMVSSLVEYVAQKEGIAVESVEEKSSPAPRAKRKKV